MRLDPTSTSLLFSPSIFYTFNALKYSNPYNIYETIHFFNEIKYNSFQLMEVGVTLGTGLSVRLNVAEEPKPGPNFATTLLLHTVVQTVKERTLKLKSAIHRNAQVLFFYSHRIYLIL